MRLTPVISFLAAIILLLTTADTTASAPNATSEALALLERLQSQSGKGVLFGHQDTSCYGVQWRGDANRSDIKDVCGDWPAVYGWDLGNIHDLKNLDGVPFAQIRQHILNADARGGINTISLHLNNPVTGGGVFDNTPAVAQILPGGSHHQDFLRKLDRIADFLNGLRRDDGKRVPIILPPFNEHNHSWSWWGREACSDEQFIALWRMTVDTFRDRHQLHQVLYAYSPQDISSQAEYLRGYPGDAYVDIFGMDYYAIWHWEQVPKLGQALSLVNQLAETHGKIAALTETGNKNAVQSDWWTEYLLKALHYDEWSRKTVWALVWRNESRTHHFAPYPGHSSVENFLRFHADPFTVFLDTE